MILFKYGSKRTNEFMKLYKGFTVAEVLRELTKGDKKWKTTSLNLVALKSLN